MQIVDAIDIALALLLAGAAFQLVSSSTGVKPPAFRQMVVRGLGLHMVGAVARFLVNVLVYGTGDSFRYFRAGSAIAEELRSGVTEAFFGSGQQWGTAFVERVTAIVLLVFGGNFITASLLFAMVAYGGLVLMALALARSYPPGARWQRGVAMVLYWPSLCFWPSTIGKEALIILAVGLVVFGWHGNGRTWRPMPLFVGLVLSLFIRPHIAMMLALCLASAEWLAPVARWSAAKVLRGAVLGAVGVAAVLVSLEQLGVDAQIDAMAQFAQERAGRTQTGGSQIQAFSGPAVLPMAFVNVLLRPFVWEVRNPVMLVSAAELIVMWWLIWKSREAGPAMFSAWRSSRLLLFAVPAACVLIVFYGAFVSNLGIIARQRVVVLPLVFMFIDLTPAVIRANTRRNGPQKRIAVR